MGWGSDTSTTTYYGTGTCDSASTCADSTGTWVTSSWITFSCYEPTTTASSTSYRDERSRNFNWLLSDSCTATSYVGETPEQYRTRVRGLQQRCEKEQIDPVLAPAYKKAEEWLLEYLSTEQRRTFEAEKFFEVIGNNSGKRYRIRAGLSGVHNIDQMNGDEIERTLCFLPDGDLPEGDILLTQKVLLETDEAYAARVANKVPRFA